MTSTTSTSTGSSSTAPATTSTETPTRAGSLVLPPQWLISKSADLTFLIGSVTVSFALLFLWRFQILTTTQLVLVWIFAFHGPHFWGTMSRTYLDPTERAARGRVLARAFAWFLVGPAIVGLGFAVGNNDIVLLFFFLAALWAYHHVVKQHFGFMALYRAKHREFGRREFQFHKYYIIASLWIPAAIVLANTDWIHGIPFVATWANAGGAEQILWGRQALLDYGPWLFLAVQVVFLGSLALRVVQGRGINLPELLIVVASVSLHWFAVTAVLAPPDPKDTLAVYALVPLVTVYHNIQYHALIWRYNTAKYRAPADGAERFGLAARLNRNLLVYFACGVAYTLVTIGIEQYDQMFAMVGVEITFLDILKGNDATPRLLAAGIWGWSFLHYWLDSKIWHVRQDANLRRVLGFPEPAAPTTQ